MKKIDDYFGCLVFDDRVMKARLSAKVYQSLRKTIDEGATLDLSVANAVAEAMKTGQSIREQHIIHIGFSHLPELRQKSMTALFLHHRMAEY